MSDKPGRNDPCYCGSGQKYKKCHMPIDKAKEKETRALKIAATYLREDILEFAQDEAFAVPFAQALPLFWNNLYELENADEMAEDEARIFFDWFAFDYPLEGGGRVLDEYAAQFREDLSTAQEKTLAAWLAAGPLSGYELLEYAGQNLTLREIMTGEEVTVFESAGHGNMKPGDVVLARIVPVIDHLEFTTDVPYIPAAEVEDLPEKLAAAEEAFLVENPAADHAAFLRANNYLLAHHALEQAEKVGRPPVARLDPNRPDKNASQGKQRFQLQR